MHYIINMRKALCKENITLEDGSLNLKYFNVKKGHYWSKKENDELTKGVIKFGACKYKEIKKHFLPDWTETEIRLRICKLLRFYNLKDYENTKFVSAEQISSEADKNRQEAFSQDQESIKEQMKNRKTVDKGVIKPKD